MDESSKQLLKEVRAPIPVKAGQPEQFDAEYERNGTCTIFMFFEPLTGQRFIDITNRRTAIDWAEQIRALVDERYPEAPEIQLVMDNLKTHCGASLYKAFEPEKARRILDRLEFCYTPRHDRWLNMAEIELSILGRQCLHRRIMDTSSIEREINQWRKVRNKNASPMNWRFKTSDARIKLKNDTRQ